MSDSSFGDCTPWRSLRLADVAENKLFPDLNKEHKSLRDEEAAEVDRMARTERALKAQRRTAEGVDRFCGPFFQLSNRDPLVVNMAAAMGKTMIGKSAHHHSARRDARGAGRRAEGERRADPLAPSDGRRRGYSLEEFLEQRRRGPYSIGPCPDAVKTGSPKPHQKPKLDPGSYRWWRPARISRGRTGEQGSRSEAGMILT
jgi:hypothetical protein